LSSRLQFAVSGDGRLPARLFIWSMHGFVFFLAVSLGFLVAFVIWYPVALSLDAVI